MRRVENGTTMSDEELLKELKTRRYNRDGTVEVLCSKAAARIEELKAIIGVLRNAIE